MFNDLLQIKMEAFSCRNGRDTAVFVTNLPQASDAKTTQAGHLHVFKVVIYCSDMCGSKATADTLTGQGAVAVIDAEQA